MTHIWDILDQLDDEDRRALQEAYNLVQNLRRRLHPSKYTLGPNKRGLEELYEIACKLSHIIEYWWESYIDEQLRKEASK